MGESNVAEFRAALDGREACERFVETEASELLGATPETMVQAFHSLLCPVDAAVLTTDFANFVVHSVREGIGERRIRIPVMVMHGEQDQMVPVSHGKWLASRIPTAEVRFLPEDGHLSLSARRIPDVHAWMLSKM